MLKIIYFALAWAFHLSPNSIKLLKQLEIGVFFFCWRQMVIAEEEGKTDLAFALDKQTRSEYRHAEVFCAIAGDQLEWSAQQLMSQDRQNWTISRTKLGEKCQTAGISKKYLSARYFFRGKAASDYSWEDKLSFMIVLEEMQALFYNEFLRYIPDEYYRYFEVICEDEERHAISLSKELAALVGVQEQLRLTHVWKRRALSAALLALIDFLRIKTESL